MQTKDLALWTVLVSDWGSVYLKPTQMPMEMEMWKLLLRHWAILYQF